MIGFRARREKRPWGRTSRRSSTDTAHLPAPWSGPPTSPWATAGSFGDEKHDYVTHVWHPDNRTGAVIDFSEGPYRWRYRQLIVTALGIIDAVEEEDDDIFDEDDTFDEDNQ